MNIKDLKSANDIKNAKPGEIITFGTYPHMANGVDETPIKWRVLQNSGSEIFVLSEYLLDCKRYHGKSASLTWFDGLMLKILLGMTVIYAIGSIMIFNGYGIRPAIKIKI